jgi:methionyl-tRNA formyltransferase
MKRVLFLSNGKKKTRIIEELIKNGCHVTNTKKKIKGIGNYDLVISFGYRHILKKSLIKQYKAPIINLHISYLPWNRGSHPNFWSFYDNTETGVTIHLIVDDKIDAGPILYRKRVIFSKKESTFISTYDRLIVEMENLFIKNIEKILNKNYTPRYYKNIGTYHKIADLPKEFLGWSSNIQEEIARLKNISKKL